MEIRFKTKELKKCAENEKYAIRRLGKRRAEIFNNRLDALGAAECFEDLRYVPGNFHELTNNRKGQWAFDLDQPYRLIITPLSLPIPLDKNGVYLWPEIVDAKIIEIVDYH